MSIPISLEQTLSTKHQQFQATNSTQKSHEQAENESLRQRVHVMSQTEKALTKKMDKL